MVKKTEKPTVEAIENTEELTLDTVDDFPDKPVPSVKAHSTRKQSVSWANLKNISMEDICQHASWASSTTFTLPMWIVLFCLGLWVWATYKHIQKRKREDDEHSRQVKQRYTTSHTAFERIDERNNKQDRNSKPDNGRD